MKKIICALLAAMMLFLCSCSSGPAIPYGLYGMEAAKKVETITRPRIALKTDNTFNLTYSTLVPELDHGTFEIKDNTVICTTDDGEKQYFFDIKGDAIFFDAERSSALLEFEGEIGIPDGSEFTLVREFTTSTTEA